VAAAPDRDFLVHARVVLLGADGEWGVQVVGDFDELPADEGGEGAVVHARVLQWAGRFVWKWTDSARARTARAMRMMVVI
jgi:hypothetical protein